MKKKSLKKRLERQEALMKRQWEYLRKNITWLPKAYADLSQQSCLHFTNLSQYCQYLEQALFDAAFKPAFQVERSPSSSRSETQFKNLAAFERWRAYQDNGERIYAEKTDNNCSSAKNSDAVVFAKFISPRLSGKILDIGCGPLPKPVYLAAYPSGLITGLDPSPDNGEHEFEYVQGHAEQLPFDDASFDTVIMATSLDHTILPELALRESLRVLRPNGKILLWEGVHYTFDSLFEEYDPAAPAQLPSDGYHLFRFSLRTLIKFLKPHVHFLDGKLLPDSVMFELAPIKAERNE